MNGQPLQVTARIPVKGQPNKMMPNKAQTLLYVAEDQSDTVDVIDINPDPTHYMTVNTVIETIPVLAPAGLLPSSFYYSDSNSAISNPIYMGSNTNSLALSVNETQLYVTNGNLNDIAVVQLTGNKLGRLRHWPDTDRVVPQLGEHQRHWHLDVRCQCQIADGPESGLVLRLWSHVLCAGLLSQRISTIRSGPRQGYRASQFPVLNNCHRSPRRSHRTIVSPPRKVLATQRSWRP